MNIPPQATFLYYGKWTADFDTILVDTLVRLKRETGWLIKEFPSYFFLTAGREIADKFGVLFDEEDLSDRVQTMHTRYLTFKQVLAMNGAYWDFPTKAAIAPECQWQKILKKNHLAGAYYHHEEPEYAKLACLFGMDDIKVEGGNEVIVISDNTENMSVDEPSCYEVGECDDEVNSPIQPATARRKLFVEKEEPSDRESTTEMGLFFIDVEHNGQLRTTMENYRVLPKVPPFNRDDAGPSLRTSHTSSCDSNSPIRLWPHLQKKHNTHTTGG